MRKPICWSRIGSRCRRDWSRDVDLLTGGRWWCDRLMYNARQNVRCTAASGISEPGHGLLRGPWRCTVPLLLCNWRTAWQTLHSPLDLWAFCESGHFWDILRQKHLEWPLCQTAQWRVDLLSGRAWQERSRLGYSSSSSSSIYYAIGSSHTQIHETRSKIQDVRYASIYVHFNTMLHLLRNKQF